MCSQVKYASIIPDEKFNKAKKIQCLQQKLIRINKLIPIKSQYFWTTLSIFLLSWQNLKWQKISICKCEKVSPFDLENFLPVELPPTMFISELINREYPNGKKFYRSNGKSFSHLQKDIFCHFYFCHNRRNDLADLVKMKKVDPFKRIAVHTALQQTHTVFSLLPEN